MTSLQPIRGPGNHKQVDGLVQDCSNSNANALELLQPCTKPSKCYLTEICKDGHNGADDILKWHFFKE